MRKSNFVTVRHVKLEDTHHILAVLTHCPHIHDSISILLIPSMIYISKYTLSLSLEYGIIDSIYF